MTTTVTEALRNRLDAGLQETGLAFREVPEELPEAPHAPEQAPAQGKVILLAKPRTKQYTPNPGSEGCTMHQAILQLHTENKPITVGAIYALCGQLLGKGKPRIQQHVQGMLRIGVLTRVSTGAYALVEGK